MRLTKVHYTDARCESDPVVRGDRGGGGERAREPFSGYRMFQNVAPATSATVGGFPSFLSQDRDVSEILFRVSLGDEMKIRRRSKILAS